MFWAMTPHQECQGKVQFSIRKEVVIHIFDEVTVALTAYEQATLKTLVSYKCNVAAEAWELQVINDQKAATTRIVN